MKKLLMTVVAGAVCAAFGSAYADSAVKQDRIQLAQTSPTGTAPPSEKGTKTPRQIEDSRVDPAKPAPKGPMNPMKGSSSAGSSSTGASSMETSPTTAGTSGASSSSSSMGTDTGGTRKGRRAARREKG